MDFFAMFIFLEENRNSSGCVIIKREIVKEKYYYVWLKCDVGIYCSMLLRVIDIID
jgi:hypothetical protein